MFNSISLMIVHKTFTGSPKVINKIISQINEHIISISVRKKLSRETGLEYLYLDSTTRGWKRSKKLMNTTSSVLGRTLQQLYEASHNLKQSNPDLREYVNRFYRNAKLLIYWHHVHPGFWLIHSIPQFPPIPEEGYDYPPTGKRNGQTGICITFKYNQYEAIGSQLLVCNPNVYGCSIQSPFTRSWFTCPAVCQVRSSEIPSRHFTTLQSAQGQNFLHLQKTYIAHIFAAWMAQRLKTHLLTETWQRKRQELPSNCSLPYHVYNIKAIKISRQSYFSSYQDHAKWCISQKGTKNHWTCIGDLNRSPYQAFRSGGFICTQNRHIYHAFQGLVLYYENCSSGW
uniref:Deoxyribonuclease-2-beta n=1 Tax=Sus scrofa TaxID=9823 RepID=I3LFM5_PIG